VYSGWQIKPEGIRLKFWAYSTHGDSSSTFDALLRVIDDGIKEDRLTSRWYVNVISRSGRVIQSPPAQRPGVFPPTEACRSG
jgi:hypothetical protein